MEDPFDSPQDDDGNTPLHHAVYQKDRVAVEQLLLNRADPNAQNDLGRTPLHVVPNCVAPSYTRWDLEILTQLLEAGASTEVRDDDGLTPLGMAVAAAPPILTTRIQMDQRSRLRWVTPNKIHDYAPVVRLLTLHASDLYYDAGYNPRHSLLHLAASRGLVSAVRFALEQGWPPNLYDRVGRTALHYAALNNQITILRLLVQAGADPNAFDANGRTPMHYAARRGSARIINDLLMLGAGPDKYAMNAWRPIDDAARHGNEEAMEALRRAGVKPATLGLPPGAPVFGLWDSRRRSNRPIMRDYPCPVCDEYSLEDGERELTRRGGVEITVAVMCAHCGHAFTRNSDLHILLNTPDVQHSFDYLLHTWHATPRK